MWFRIERHEQSRFNCTSNTIYSFDLVIVVAAFFRSTRCGPSRCSEAQHGCAPVGCYGSLLSSPFKYSQLKRPLLWPSLKVGRMA
jgi:hypothetical protein